MENLKPSQDDEKMDIDVENTYENQFNKVAIQSSSTFTAFQHNLHVFYQMNNFGYEFFQSTTIIMNEHKSQ
jgi:pantothenate kinase